MEKNCLLLFNKHTKKVWIFLELIGFIQSIGSLWESSEHTQAGAQSPIGEAVMQISPVLFSLLYAVILCKRNKGLRSQCETVIFFVFWETPFNSSEYH